MGRCGGVCRESARGGRSSLPAQRCWERWAWGRQRGPQSKRQLSGGVGCLPRHERQPSEAKLSGSERGDRGKRAVPVPGAGAGRRELMRSSGRGRRLPPAQPLSPQLLLLGGGCQKAAPNYSRFPGLAKAGALGWLTPVSSVGCSVRVTPGPGEKMHCAGAGECWHAKPSERHWGG